MEKSLTYRKVNTSFMLIARNWLLSFCYLTFLLLSIAITPKLQAQSLQWSQFTTQNEYGEDATWTMALEKEQGGAIYTFSLGTARDITPTFPTADLEYYGNFKSGAQQYSYLSKYSADGSTLEWVRVFTGGENAAQGNGAFRPTEMELSPTGELVVIFEGVGVGAPPELITADAQHPNAPPFNTNGDITPIIAKFDANGDLLYGSYLFDAALGRVRYNATYGATTYGQHLEIGADGTIYWDGFFTRTDGQPMNFPTSPNALANALDQASTLSGNLAATYFTIINPDNTTRFATWIDIENSNSNSNASVIDTKVAPNGDLYMVLLNYTTESVVGVDVPANAYVPSVDESVGNQVIRFDANGNVLGSTFLPYINDFNPTAAALTLRPNGNVIATQGGGQVFELSPDLTTLIQTANPFGVNASAGAFQTYTDVELDDDGRIHFTAVRNLVVKPTTPGALSSASDPGRSKSYYGILDCNFELVYGTEMTFGEKSNAALNNQENYLFELEVEGCNAYMAGFVRGSNEYPVTPTAFSNDGTQVLSGYDITPIGRSSGAGSTHRNGVLMAFNYPVMEAGTNTITTPAVTTFCLNSVALPIEGTPTNYITPQVLGPADDSPAPTPTYYQWQIGTSATGPWTDIEDSNVETLSPEAPATAGTYFYRRLVRQTPYGRGLCVPGCDIEDASNVVELSFSNNITHSTDIPEGTYGICAGSTTIDLMVNITTSPDGESGPYDYRLTTTNDLVTTALGIQGQVANSSTPIPLSVGASGDYILQVTDSRGCVSFDTLVIENLALDAGEASKFTCGEATIPIGPISLPPEYINFPTNSFTWSPATGLDNPNAVSPMFTHGLAVGASTIKYLSFNGCLVDSVEIINDAVDPLPTLPNLEFCQGETAKLGTNGMDDVSLITAQSGVTYEWAPGLGLVDNMALNTDITTASAPAGVNERIYTLLATTGNTGCVASTTQRVTIYRQPNQSFEFNRCMANGCDNSLILTAGPIGTDPEPGISYSWTATVVDDPNNIGNTGVPSDAEALSWIVDPASSFLEVNAGTPGNGYADLYGYTITYVRTSFNPADPTCMRTDTARVSYCCGGGPGCDLALGNVPTVNCSGVDNNIGLDADDIRTDGNYYWARLDGTPLNNELFDFNTGDPLTGAGPHPAQVYALPSGLTAIDYSLTFIYNNPNPGDTCNVDIKVFPAAVSTPNLNYASPQAVCQGAEYTIVGDPEQPGLLYSWSPLDAFATVADTARGLPTVMGLDADTELFVRIDDPSTGCFALDTVQLVVTPVAVNAGEDGTFCDQGAIVEVGGDQAIQGYTYQWTAVPAAGVSFTDDTAPTTTATLPATTAGQTIILYLNATNGLTAANCERRDSIIMTASSNPTITIPPVRQLCTGGQVTIGPITPDDPNLTYTWTGAGIVSGQGTSSIVVDAAGVYNVEVNQNGCISNTSVTVSAAVEPTVDVAPPAPCATDATIGAVGMSLGDRVNWAFTWDNYSGLIANESDFHTITVRPTVETTYTLTATHNSGCVRTYPIVVPAAAYSAELPNTLNFCEGDDTTLPLNDFSGVGGSVVWTADISGADAYLSSTTANEPELDLSAAPAGQYNYTATVTYAGGCTSTATTRVNVGKPLEGIAGFDREICLGECVEIGTSRVSGVSYSWSSDPADSTLVANTFNQPTVCPTENTIYTLTYTDLAGCTHTEEVEVRIIASPTLVVQDIIACQNSTGTAVVDLNTAIVTNTGSAPSFFLDERGLIPASNPVSSNGDYYVQCELNGCVNTEIVNVNIIEPPIGTVTPSYNCTAGQGILTIANSETGVRYDYSAGSSYTGSATYATATDINGGVAIVSGLSVGFPSEDYTVRFFGADSTCTKDVTVTITPNGNPEVTAFAIQPSCVNGVPQSDGYLQILSVANGDRYHWSVGGTFDDNSGASTYANATVLGSFPDTIAMNLANPSGSQDYTIRVYNSSNECFRDVVVTMNEQDCTFSCECTEYLYVNDVDEDVTHKFAIDPVTGGVTEIGSPWLDDPDVFFQHGIGQDINGNIYIADSFRDGPFNRMDAFGNVIENDVFSAENRSIVSNIIIENNVLYAIRETEPVIFAYDVCTGMKIGEMDWAPTDPANTDAWGLFTANDGNWYIASREATPMIYSGSLDISLYTNPATNSGTALFMPVNPATGTGGLDINIMSVARDIDGNFYVVENQTGTGNNADLIVAKYAPDGTFLKQVQADNTFAANTTNGQPGFSGARAIVYSESSNKLYLGSFDNCVTVLDTALNELAALNMGNPQQGSPKAIRILKECCPTISSGNIDFDVCYSGADTTIFLQDVLACEGIIAEGVWAETTGHGNLAYESCDNTILVTGDGGCAQYTFSSDGTNANAQCSAFSFTVNICSECPCTAPSNIAAFAIQPSCTNGVAQSDGYLQISSVTDGDRYHWSVGNTFDDNGGANTYANATALGNFPDTITMNLANPSGSQDYTIRVYNGADDCFTDVVVTMNEQDCTVGCDCKQMVYLNDPQNSADGFVHKFQVNPDGTFTEIGNPWFPPGAGLPSPHGLGIDLNGFLYIGETPGGQIRKLTCEGDIFPETGATGFAIDDGGFNFSSRDGILYVPSANDNQINAYSSCDGGLIGYIQLADIPDNPSFTANASIDWGFHIAEDGTFYVTSGWNDYDFDEGESIFRFTPTPDDFSNNTIFSPILDETSFPAGVGLFREVWGITSDAAGNFYVVLFEYGDASFNPPYDTWILKYDSNANLIASANETSAFDNMGYELGRGISYYEPLNILYVAGGTTADCVAMVDANTLNYIGPAIGHVSGQNPKGINLLQECCPTNNNITIDTTLCTVSVNDTIFLQNLINCTGTICEGLWQEGVGNTNLTFNDCNNSVTVNALGGCGTFTLASDGTGNNPQCGAFVITVNIEVGDITAPVFTEKSNQTVCVDGDPTEFVVATPASGSNTITYQWASSSDSISFTDIASATNATYDPPSGILDTTYYRVIASVAGGCSSGNCLDTAYVTVRTMSCLAVGNLVWEDLDNSGTVDAGEPGIEDVELILFSVGPDGVKDGGDDVEMRRDTTDANGNYLFDQLDPDTYYVKINSGIPTGMTSSTGTGADGTQPLSVEPGAMTNNDVNDNDDGTQMGTMIMSDTVQLIVGMEPTDDGDTDNNTNLSVDFGLIRYLSLGNLVWEDANNDGLNNNGETGINGVTVYLLDDGADDIKGNGDDTILDSIVTANSGQYLFESLYPGEYYVKLNSGIPSGMISSTAKENTSLDTEPAADPDNNVNDDDNGTQMGAMVMSELVALTLSEEPTDDGDVDSTSNLSVDFGLYTPLSLGNLVWLDVNNDGMSTGENGIANVELTLFSAGPDGAKDGGDDVEIGKDTTDSNGNYLFEELQPGTYYVKISDGVPAGLISSTGSGADGSGNNDFEPGAFTNNNTDNNDDGTQMGAMVMSNVVVLSINDEPTNDADTDPNTNTTVDFGLVPFLSLGNLVWDDRNNDGLSAGESGIDGVEVILFSPGPDGAKDGGDDVALDTMTTTGGGLYRFDSLLAGDYYIKLNSGLPAGKVSSTGEGTTAILGSGPYETAPDPDTDTDDDDNGTQMNLMVMSDLVTLTMNSTEPDDNDNTGHANLRIDFGLTDCPTVDSLTPTAVADRNLCTPDGTTVNLTVKTRRWDGQNINVVFSTTELTNPYTEGTNPQSVVVSSGMAMLDVTLPANTGTSPVDYYLYAYLPNAAPEACQDFDSTLVTVHPMIDAGPDALGAACNNNSDGISVVNLGGLLAANVTVGGTYERADGKTEGTFNATAGTFDANGITLPAAQPDTLSFYYIVNGATGAVGNCVADTAFLQVVVVECCPVITASALGTNQDTLCSNENQFDLTITHEMNPGEMAIFYNTGTPATFSQIYDMLANGQMQQLVDVVPMTTSDVSTTLNMQMLPANTLEDSIITYNIYTILDSDNGQIDGDASDGFVCQPMAVTQITILPETPTATVKDSTICTENSKYTDATDNVLNLNDLITSGSTNGTWADDDASGGLVDSIFTATEAMAGQTYDFTYTLLGADPNSTRCDNNTYTISVTVNRCFVDLGNLVWNDVNNDGLSTGEMGIDGVEVIVFSTTNDTKGDGDDVAVDTVTTSSGGAYLFTELLPGDYYVKLNSGIPTGFISSTGEGADGSGSSTFEPASDPDVNATNGDDNGTQMGTMVMSDIVELSLNGEPTDDGDTDAYSNLSVDFGLYEKLSIGNLVWFDLNNNGLYDSATEFGVDDVEVILFQSTNAVKGDGDDVAVDTVMTSGGGNYLFESLDPGDYFVKLNSGIPAGYISANGAGVDGSGTATTEPAVDPDATNSNNDDDGTQMGTMIMSDLVTLHLNTEPTDDDDTNANTNLAVDFGLIPVMSLGNLVWEDANNDGLNNNGETGIDGITVYLLDDGADDVKGNADDTILDSVITTGGGLYLFDSLYPGEYYVKLNSGIAAGMVSSTGEGTVQLTGMGTSEPAPDPDTGDTNNDDDGTQMGTMVMSDLVTLMLNSEPINDEDTDNNSNLAVDFGLYQTLSIGNLVWEDQDNDGLFDVGEPGLDTVELILYTLGPDGVKGGGDDVEIDRDTTDASGNYLFELLPEGTYYVKVNSGLPTGFVSSTGAGVNGQSAATFEPGATTNDDADNDDDGTQMDNMIMSDTIQLVKNSEPTNDGDSNPNTNTSVDFGVTPSLTLGNLVWEDLNNNGTVDAGEAGIDGIEVILFALGADGQKGTADDEPIDTVTTAGGGNYLFEGLAPNEYFVKLNSGIPTGFISSTGEGASVANGSGTFETAPDPDATNTDNDDNGTGMGSATTYMVMSDPVTLILYDEPTNDGDTDVQTNLAVDFGLFETLELGNLVWEDLDNDGTVDAGEPGFANVEVILFKDGGDGNKGSGDDVEIGRDTTDATGAYLFQDLLPGEYYIKLNSGIPNNFVSSTGEGALAATGTGTYETAPDPDATNTDNDDDGTLMVMPDGSKMVMSDLISMELYDESITDGDTDSTTNYAVDFGLFELLSVGNLVWEDLNNDGIADASEPRLENIVVTLHQLGPDGQKGTADDVIIGNDTTNATGNYLFDNLLPGDYYLKINDLPFGMVSSTGEGINSTSNSGPYEPAPDADGDTDNLDDGIYMDTMIMSSVFSLNLYDEPTNDGDTDNSSNLSVDFGLFQTLILGNLVWEDLNNNGIADTNEPGMTGIEVILYRDGGNGTKEIDGSGDDVEIGRDTTDNTGHYMFMNLEAGMYYIKLNSGIPDGFMSSTGEGTATITGAGTYEPAPDPDVFVDGDDNGTQMDMPDGSIMIMSDLISMVLYSEQTDSVINMDVDFGLYNTLEAGNFVWNDLNNNGLADAGEPGIEGIEVIIYRTTDATKGNGDDVEIDRDTTDSMGMYLFQSLEPGDYWVKLNSGIPDGFFSSTGEGTTTVTGTGTFEPSSMVDDNIDDNDDGTQMVMADGSIMIMSDIVSLDLYDEPDSTSGSFNDANYRIDFGLYESLELGNLVWEDLDNDGLKDANEPGFPNIEVVLFQLGSDGQKGTADDVEIAKDTTDAAGHYLFQDLNPNEYYVKLNSGIPAGFVSSTGEGSMDANGSGPNEPAADPDGNTNEDDDGTQMGNLDGTLMVMSDPISLALQDEPTNDGDTDNTTNYSVDFGLFETLELGNLVWEDLDNDGIAEAGEPGFDNVEVILFKVGPDGQKGTTDDIEIGRDTTDANGRYLFADLYPGEYYVKLNSGIPIHFVSSTGEGVTATTGTGVYEPAADPDATNTNGDDDGTQMGNPDGSLMIMSDVISMVLYDEPTDDGDVDATTNYAVDFGLYELLSLGNLVWEDLNNDGIADTNEPGIEGVEVLLFRSTNGTKGDSDDTEVARDTTDANGHYLFEDLNAGEYFVKLNSGIPRNMVSSTGEGVNVIKGNGTYEPATDPDVANTDGDDSGNNMGAGASLMIMSDLVSLQLYDEPIDDADTDPSTNTTVDFGLIRKLDIGGLVWEDTNNDGVIDIGEIGLNNIMVALFMPGPDGLAGTADDILVDRMLTDLNGVYTFECLYPDAYFIQLEDVPTRVASSDGNGFGAHTGNGPLENVINPNDDTDSDDNGNQATPTTVLSDVIDLTLYGEPVNDEDTLNYTNTTIDFALTPLNFAYIFDPCNCLGNESSSGAGDGQFSDNIIILSTVDNETWTLVAGNGMLTADGSANVALGTVATPDGKENGYFRYTLDIRHIDGIGYNATFSNGKGELFVNNYCTYDASCSFVVTTNPDGTPGQPIVNPAKQTFIMGTTNTPKADTLLVCDNQSMFLDDGSIDGLYADTSARDNRYTICPQTPWQQLKFVFSEFGTAPGDSLYVYDGQNISAPLIGRYGGEGVSQTGGWVATNCLPSVNPSGCMTFQFITNNDNKKSVGWMGKFECSERNIELSPPNNLTAKLACTETYKVFDIGLATVKAACGTVQDSQIVRIYNALGDVCIDTCLAATETISDTFALGAYRVEYKLKSDTVKTTEAIMTVQGAPLVCNDEVDIPLGSACAVLLTPDDLLEGTCDTITDTVYYFISIIGTDKNGADKIIASGGGKGGNYPMVAKEMIDQCGGTLRAKIEKRYYNDLDLTFCNNGPQAVSCEVVVNVSDQTAPFFQHNNSIDTFKVCLDDITPAALGIQAPKAIDNCDTVAVSFVGTTVQSGVAPCDTVRATFRWSATDVCGNVATLNQQVVLIRPDTGDVVQAKDVVLSCGQDTEANFDDLTKVGVVSLKIGQIKNGQLIPTDTIALSADKYICGYILQKRDVKIPADCGVKVFRYWDILDWCDSDQGVMPVDTQFIELRDTLAPTFTADSLAPTTIELDHFSCTFNGNKLAKPTATDNCSAVSVRLDSVFRIEEGLNWGVATGDIAQLDCDSFLVRWVAEDACHEQLKNDTITQIILIEDNTRPSAVCADKINLSIGQNSAQLHWRDIDAGSFDACGIAKYEVSRDSITWDSIVRFTCEDTHKNVKVYLRVTDTKKNQNVCWMDVLVEDKIAPICSDLPDQRGACDEGHTNLAPTDTDDDGQMEDSEWVNLTAEQAADFNARYGNPNCSDNVNCGALVIQQQYQLVQKSCGEATLKRRFRAVDWNGEGNVSNWSEQTITIESKADWSITLPADWRGTCGNDVPTTEVQIVNGACDLLAYEVEEQTFTTVEDACLKVVRTISIINWCKYEAGQPAVQITRIEGEHGLVSNSRTITVEDFANAGKLEYVQILKLQDDTAPTITVEAVDNCIEGEACQATKRFAISATDCNEAATEALVYAWTLRADGMQLSTGNGPNFEATVVPNTKYEVAWKVTDNCGNAASETVNYEFKDCKKPSPYCIHGVAVELMQTGIVQIWATDVERNSFDNCTPKDKLDFRIWHVTAGNEPTNLQEVQALPKVITFNCAYLGTQTVNLYAIDEAGNWDFCVTYVNVQDNMNACEGLEPQAGIAKVEGVVMDWKQQTVERVQVQTTTESANYTTQTDGHYELNLPTEQDHTIVPTRTDAPLNGVSTFDLVLISKHILGIEALESPYQQIAADVNVSGKITAFDMVQIRQLILNIKTEFDQVDSWQFVASDYAFNTDQPLTEAYPNVTQVSDLRHHTVKDFVAIKMGDVSGNARANSLVIAEDRTTTNSFDIEVEDRWIQAGRTYEVAFTTTQLANIEGYQFTLNYDGLTLEKLASGVATVDNFGLQRMDEGQIMTSWNRGAVGSGSTQLVPSTVLFTIEFTATTDGQLSEQIELTSRPTVKESYDLEGNLLDVELTFTESTDIDQFDLFQNEPNPFQNETRIGFYLPGDSDIELVLRDETGRLLRTIKDSRAKGYNILTIDHTALPNGFIYYQLNTRFGSKSKKMLRIE